MNRRTARHLMLELMRRVYLDQHKTLKGFGKTAKFYDRNWKPKVNEVGGYKAAWESDLLKTLRTVNGM